MTLEEIRELIQLAQDTGVADLEVQRGESRVRIRRAVSSNQEAPSDASVSVTAPVTPLAAAAVASPPPSAHEALETVADANLVLVKSPIVGTFYESPSSGAPPFVRIGEHIHPGKVLCIIESMKLMNEIEAETAGIIESKLVPNGQPVEYGEALFAIRTV
jgi:acetyl-CoA carboxylase biotin carboxyl carrier protein